MSQLETSMIKFKGPERDVTAYLSRPGFSGKWPGLILIHEIWGLVPHVKRVADRFAAEGFAVLAPDLMGSDPELAPLFSEKNVETVMKFMHTLPPGKARDQTYVQKEMANLPEDERATVGQFMGKVFGGGLPYDRFVMELSAGHGYLKGQPYVNPSRIGSLGFCFGGGMSFRLACTGLIQGSVVFYGQNPEPLELIEKINCPVLGHYGAEDTGLNATLDKMVAEMAKYKKDYEMRIYSGAPHAFFNDSNLVNYRAGAASEAWDKTMTFFGRTLKAPPVVLPPL